MTEYFEVLARDGAARLGDVRLDTSVTTPALADDIVTNAGSTWAVERQTPEPQSDRIAILPHRGLPPGTPDPVADAFSEPPQAIEGPTGAVVDSRTAADMDVDLYALSTAQGIVDHAAAFCETLIETRRAIPDDTALYLSGIATPVNVALLAYAGVDLVDTDRARIAGTRGRYLTTDGATHLEELRELTCPCAACSGGIDAFDRAACVEHNVSILAAELARVRERVRTGRLREFVSARARHVPWLTAALREFDQEATYLRARAPLYRRSEILATTEDDLYRPEVRRYAERVAERYVDRFDVPLVLLPCSAKKPYSESQSHGQFRDAIAYRAHMVSLSSPIGVVPQELECTYPAQHYDVPVTGRWSATERDVIADLLTQYLENATYPRIIAHVPPGAYRDIVERAAEAAGAEPTYTVTDHPTTDESLTRLAEALDGEAAYSREERREYTVRALADYQFGPGAGDDLFGAITVESPYPKHRVLGAENTHLATMVPAYGLLALTIAGAHRWDESDVPNRTVEIDDFVPHGDVLAPGILDADPSIRVGEEVLVEGPSAFAIGRATMHGEAMVESTRGVAVDVRHTEERS